MALILPINKVLSNEMAVSQISSIFIWGGEREIGRGILLESGLKDSFKKFVLNYDGTHFVTCIAG